MNASQVEFEKLPSGATQETRLKEVFEQNEGTWLAMPFLAKQISETGIGVAVHSRVAGCRKRFGMRIVNRVRKNESGVCVSEYCYEGPTNDGVPNAGS